jgi:hypothetical protein
VFWCYGGISKLKGVEQQGVQVGKNISKKVAKIPPGELQEC